ncbi:MAG: hypothetical protein K5770_09690 [Lachnospiraceae bacterium]|nr:hypothetical protein [Lachnospiraceae bacterium]
MTGSTPYQKAGRKFALVALGSDGVHFYLDTDTSVDTITVDLDLNGYVFDVVYAD